MTERLLKLYWALVLAVPAYLVLVYSLNFTQDDAYISYRYVANYLNGHGLVYNIGERIEGFTNFGWTTFLLLVGVLGGDYIWWSKFAGALFGVGIIALTFLMGRDLLGDDNQRYTNVAVLLVGVNQSLAYWSPAGLETAAFGFFALLSFLLYLRRHWMLIFALVMAVWLRPEGAVITAIILAIEAVQTKRLPGFSLVCAAIAFVLSLPFVGFKLFYYGSILPNPFYAKTSFDLDQFKNGLEYAGQFVKHYGFYYAGLVALVVPLWMWRRLAPGLTALWSYVVLYLAYVIVIGGDVLKVHRFFMPLFGPWALLMVLPVREGIKNLHIKTQYLVLVLVLPVMLVLTYKLPRAFVEQYNRNEIAFVDKMQFKARALKDSDSTNFSVAIATIGMFGYKLLGHSIIDMVGLTDSTIARYSEDPIPGMQTTWKEQKHNTKYLLERSPDYIMFSTGIKPSAPAERALLLYRQFVECYRTVGWFYGNPGTSQGVISSIFKRRKPITGELVPYYPVEYVQEYKLALDAYSKSDHRTAMRHYEAALKASPRPYNPYLVHQMAFSLQMLGDVDRAYAIFENLVATDSTIFESHMELYKRAAYLHDTAGMRVHREWIQKLVPWYWPRFDSTIQSLLARAR
ncbi:MAG: hypothetical protein AB1772_05220 [Candidatus Zixiibacteriota bacterium]